jgi:hypothetical protein
MLPTWTEIDEKRDAGEPLNVLEKFIYNNEPAGDDDDEWREDLMRLIEFVRSYE